ncbi:MAG: hypothetical protein A2270_01300 [Elusimicrobia bacterium RIFOXYA12_FULL_51_18]|nr:MAG: hypothetical protein A2270_01300 [Elusimicrobia bacterium RIFOXYA12_FULL_51_18]OGS30032.1 MAG: hypothetical protein A2218_12845 [Elusimicrobia bacterium RIFOXYA2_FULL_53_38]
MKFKNILIGAIIGAALLVTAIWHFQFAPYSFEIQKDKRRLSKIEHERTERLHMLEKEFNALSGSTTGVIIGNKRIMVAPNKWVPKLLEKPELWDTAVSHLLDVDEISDSFYLSDTLRENLWKILTDANSGAEGQLMTALLLRVGGPPPEITEFLKQQRPHMGQIYDYLEDALISMQIFNDWKKWKPNTPVTLNPWAYNSENMLEATRQGTHIKFAWIMGTEEVIIPEIHLSLPESMAATWTLKIVNDGKTFLLLKDDDKKIIYQGYVCRSEYGLFLNVPAPLLPEGKLQIVARYGNDMKFRQGWTIK